MKNPWKTIEFWLVITLAAIAPAAVILYYPHAGQKLHLWNHDIYHWFTWIGASYLAAATPVYFYIKRRLKQHYQAIMKIHIFGNILAFLLISFHFTYQIGASPIPGIYTNLGLTLYIALALLLITGFLLRYHLSGKYWLANLYLHLGLVTTFYLVVFVHVLHGLNVI
jgi:hypothetical protein